MNKLVYSLLFALALTVPLGHAAPAFAITLTEISTGFPNPIGIDHHEEGAVDRVVMSVNYIGGTPNNFVLVASDGTQSAFSGISGFTDEVKIATARTGSVFPAGTLFTGNGIDGEIARINPDGTIFGNPWVSLPGAGNGLMRGSLYVDTTGVYDGDLIVVTTLGEVWRINSVGVASFIDDVNVHLEGVTTVPSDVAQYGPLAGKIIAGAEGVGLLYVFNSAGFVATYDVDVNIEDIDLITGTENFYGVNFGTSRLLGAPASEFAAMAGDILLTSEFGVSPSGLYVLSWNGVSLTAPQLPLSPGSETPGQWEHVTFSSAGIGDVPPTDQVIGGEIIPIDTAVLLIAGAQSSSVWLISVLGLAVGLGFIFLRKKSF